MRSLLALLFCMALTAAGETEPTGPSVVRHSVSQIGDAERPATLTFSEHLIADKYGYAYGVAAADLDGDGDRDLDIVATAWGGVGQIVWFENTGDPKTAWNNHLLKDKRTRANQPIVADMVGDGRPDIIATAEIGSNELRWWRNTGSAP